MIAHIAITLALLSTGPLGDALAGARTAAIVAGTASRVAKDHKRPTRSAKPASRTTTDVLATPADHTADVAALARALHVPASVLELRGEVPCSSPGVFKQGSKSECVVYATPDGLAMLYYAQLRGDSPKPARALQHSATDGVWEPITLPRS